MKPNKKTGENFVGCFKRLQPYKAEIKLSVMKIDKAVSDLNYLFRHHKAVIWKAILFYSSGRRVRFIFLLYQILQKISKGKGLFKCTEFCVGVRCEVGGGDGTNQPYTPPFAILGLINYLIIRRPYLPI